MPDLPTYLELITAWHATRPRFVATVALMTAPFADAQALLAQLATAFDLDTAIGAQLDAVGQWIGRSRYLDEPLQVYFSFDDDNLGFDLGIWKGPYDPDEGITRMDDDTYRALLRLKTLANSWDGTLPSIAPALQREFPGSFIEDNMDMSMTFGIPAGNLNAMLTAILTSGYIPIKPEGVRLNVTVTTVETGPLFGFDVDDTQIAGFDAGSWGKVISSA